MQAQQRWKGRRPVLGGALRLTSLHKQKSVATRSSCVSGQKLHPRQERIEKPCGVLEGVRLVPVLECEVTGSAEIAGTCWSAPRFN